MAREWQVEAKRVYHQKFAEAAEAEETYREAIRRTVEATEVLERHVKTDDNEGRLIGDHRSGFLPNTHRAARRGPSGNSTHLHGQLCQSSLHIVTTRHLAPHRPKLVPSQREGYGLAQEWR